MLQEDIKMKKLTTVFVSKCLAYDKKTTMVTLWSDYDKADNDKWENECSEHLCCNVVEESAAKYSAAALKTINTGKILMVKPVKVVKYFCSHK